MRWFSIVLAFLLARATADAGRDTLFVVIDHDTVHIWNANVDVNCACQFVFDVTGSESLITIVERDTARAHATCVCRFDLCVSLTGLEAGNYRADVYRHFFLPYDTVIYVGSTTFDLGASGQSMSLRGYQSPCLPIVSISEQPAASSFSLEQNYPNPFNPTTVIRYSLPVISHVTLKVFNVLGQEILTLVDEVEESGYKSVEFDAGGLASGVYFCRLVARHQGAESTASYVQTKKLMIMK